MERDRVPRMYGNALAYRVNFAILEAFARAAGWDAARTDNPSLSVHTAGIRTMPKAPPAYHRVFRKIYDRDPKGHDFSDFRESALLSEKYGDHDRAIRYLERCLRLSPADLEIFYHLSQACRAAGFFEKAMSYAKKGHGLVGYGTFDFEGEVARADFSRDAFARSSGVPDDFWGYYVQGSVSGMPSLLKSLLPHVFDRSGASFTAVLRYDFVDLDGDRGEALEPGINFRPISDTVFKFSYRYGFKTIGPRSGPGTEGFHDDGFIFSISTYF